MKIIALSLTGFKGIRDGLGRDAITLDLARLAGDARLVAIKGANGRGKSTLLDNLHPFAVMPSRAAADGLGGFSFYDQVALPESTKLLEWEHDGVHYRSQLVFRLNGKKKTEAFLHVRAGERWLPYQAADGTLSDGKVDTYKRCVEAILGSQETFFTSAFSAQGKRPLTAFRNSEIKALMADLLGHEEIRRIGAQAMQVNKLLTAGLATLRQEQATLAAEDRQLSARRDALGDPAARIAQAVALRTQTGSAHDAAKLAAAAVRAQIEAAAQTEARRAQLDQERQALADDGRKALGQIDERLTRERQLGADLEQRIARRIQAAQDRRRELETQGARLQKILAAAGAVRRARQRSGISEQVVGQRMARLAQLRSGLEDLRTLTAQIAAARHGLAGIEREAGQAVLRVKELSTRHGLVAAVPCAGSDLQGRCQLLGDAMQAKTLMPSADLDIARLEDGKARVQADIARLQQALGDALAGLRVSTLEGAQARLAVLENQLAVSRRKTAARAVLAARSGEIEQAALALDSVRTELAELQRAAQGETDVERAERARVAAAMLALQEQRGAERAKYRDRYDHLSRLLAELPPPIDDAQLRAAESAVATAQRAAAAADSAYMNALRDTEGATHLDEQLTALHARQHRLGDRGARVERALCHWTLFARCMSNDGLIALLIDEAGPTLAALANDLLLACHGPRFTLSIQTQVPTDKGDLREGFDIVVFDAESGSSKSVRDMSGGQRVWINECMIRAIALYLAQNSGRHYGTLFCDEADGPLDPEHKRMFMAMKRAVLEIGGYHQEFFISQSPELTDMADAVIDLETFTSATAGG